MFEMIAIPLYGMACFGGGYYLAHRGLAGIKSDLVDVKTDLESLRKHNVPLAPTP